MTTIQPHEGVRKKTLGASLAAVTLLAIGARLGVLVTAGPNVFRGTIDLMLVGGWAFHVAGALAVIGHVIRPHRIFGLACLGYLFYSTVALALSAPSGPTLLLVWTSGAVAFLALAFALTSGPAQRTTPRGLVLSLIACFVGLGTSLVLLSVS